LETRNVEIRRGDIYWADLKPQAGSVLCGRHPVLIVQNNKGNVYSPNVLVSPLTSKPRSNQPTHVVVGIESGLKVQSTLLAEDIRPLSKSELEGWIGRIDNSLIPHVNRALSISLDLLSA
jgi:mRNA interferase MazF